MTDTPVRLAAISDAGVFEQLVALYIDASEPELKGIVQTGINLCGKTIASSVDGLHLRFVSGQQYVLFLAATTTEKKALRRKWFGGRNTRGDIKKASVLLRRWQRDLPYLKGRLILATNRFLDETLLRELATEATARDLEIPAPIEASRLSRFLDFTADGQYARHVLFGREPERINLSLLVEIAKESLVAHEHYFPFLSGDQKSIMREATRAAMQLLRQSRASLVFLEGASGCGKSTVLRQIGALVNGGMGAALWIPGHYVELGASLSSLIGRALREYRPSLLPASGADALRMAGEADFPLVILVDDINRNVQPLRAIAALEALASIATNVSFVVPIWPRRRGTESAAPSHDARRDTVFVTSFSKEEQREMSQQLPVHLVDLLAGDPFLCGLADRSTRVESGGGRGVSLRQVIDARLLRATSTTADALTTGTVSEYQEAVRSLAESCVFHDSPEPNWVDLRRGLGSTSERLVELGSQRVIGWIDETGQAEVWRWPHERFRDLVLARAMARRLEEDEEWLKTAWVTASLANPALAEVWALTVMLLDAKGLRTQLIDALSQHQPLALSKLLRLGAVLLDDDDRGELARGIRRRLDERTSRHHMIGDLCGMMLYDIVQTEHPIVLELLPEATQSHWELIGRTRNGDVRAAIRLLGDENEFWPAVSYSFLESALSRLRDRYTRNGEDDCQSMGEGDDDVRGCLVLSGYLQAQVGRHGIEQLWTQLPQQKRQELYPEVLWALARCGGEDIEPTLKEVLSLASELWDAADDSASSSHAHFIIQEVGNALSRWPIGRSVGRILARIIRDLPTGGVGAICSRIDDPEIIEALLRAFKHPPSVWRCRESVDPLECWEDRERFPTRPESRNRLWEIVAGREDAALRRWAFLLWREACERDDLGLLRGIGSEDPLFKDALRLRIRLRDTSAAPELTRRLHSDPEEWCSLAPALMHDKGVRHAFFESFPVAMRSRRRARPWYAARYLSRADVVELLDRERVTLLADPWAWSSVWRNGAPEAVAFMREAIANETDTKELNYVFHSSRQPYPVTQDMLDAITPVLDKLPQRALEMDLDRLATRSGFHEWARRHVLPRASVEYRSTHYPTHEELAQSLTSAAASVGEGEPLWAKSGLFRWLHRSAEIGDALRSVLCDWIGSQPETACIVVAAFVLERIGAHSDLAWWSRLHPQDAVGEEVHAHVSRVLQRRRWRQDMMAT